MRSLCAKKKSLKKKSWWHCVTLLNGLNIKMEIFFVKLLTFLCKIEYYFNSLKCFCRKPIQISSNSDRPKLRWKSFEYLIFHHYLYLLAWFYSRGHGPIPDQNLLLIKSLYMYGKLANNFGYKFNFTNYFIQFNFFWFMNLHEYWQKIICSKKLH